MSITEEYLSEEPQADVPLYLDLLGEKFLIGKKVTCIKCGHLHKTNVSVLHCLDIGFTGKISQLREERTLKIQALIVPTIDLADYPYGRRWIDVKYLMLVSDEEYDFFKKKYFDRQALANKVSKRNKSREEMDYNYIRDNFRRKERIEQIIKGLDSNATSSSA